MKKKLLLIATFLILVLVVRSSAVNHPHSILKVDDVKGFKNEGLTIEKATITVDLNKHATKIAPLIYGQFIEYLGRCIDGGIYEEGSPLSSENGFRQDVLQKVKDLKTPLLRFPGGTVVKIYHWQDGIGEKRKRPRRKNLIWGGVNDNHFGTSEFIDYCRQIGAEPFLIVNMATGTPEEASNWVEYCNGTEDTFYANLRRSQGYEKPFNVKYWGIGNEESAAPDAGKDQNIKRYIEDSWQFIKLMKLQDPTIKITLDGNPSDLSWSRKLMQEIHPVCDFLSVHFYAMPSDTTYSGLLQSVENFNQSFDSLREVLKTIPDNVSGFSPWYRFPPRQQPVKLAVDEWGIWDANSGKGSGAYQLEYTYNWSHALATAKFLNIFQRNSDIIGLATWAQTVNVLAPIMTSKEGSFCQTVYTPLQAFRKYTLENHLDAEVNSPKFESNQQSVDATATISDDFKTVVLAVLNLSQRKSMLTGIAINHLPQGMTMKLIEYVSYSAASLNAINTFGKNNVMETKKELQLSLKEGFEFEIAPATINFLVLKMQ